MEALQDEDGVIAEIIDLPDGFVPVNEGPYFRVYPTHPSFPITRLHLAKMAIGAVRVREDGVEIIHSLSQPTEGRKNLGPGIWYEYNRIFQNKVLFGIEVQIIYHPHLDVAFYVEGLGTILEWRFFLPGKEKERKEAIRRFLRDARLRLEVGKIDRKVLEAFREALPLPDNPVLSSGHLDWALDLYHWRLIQRMERRDEELVRRILSGRK